VTRLEAAEPAVQPDDIAAAMDRIRDHVRETPILDTPAGQLGLPSAVTLKLELLQHAGSFKPRGAFNRVLSARAAGEVGDAGLIAASGGNHGAAVAYVGQQLGHRAEIFMPSTSPAIKRHRIESYGAIVNVIDGYFDDAHAACVERQLQTGALAIHPFEHAAIIAGQGTMAIEIDDQVGDYDTLVVSAGGGGFIAGQAAWVQGRRRVVSVEPATSRCLHAAREAGSPMPATRSARTGSAPSPGASSSTTSTKLCWSTTTASAPRSAPCGTNSAWSSSQAARQRSPPCALARTCPSRASALSLPCAAATVTRPP